MVKLVEMRTRLFFKEKVYLLTGPPEKGSLYTMQDHRGSTRGWSGGRRQERGESLGQSLYWTRGKPFRFG